MKKNILLILLFILIIFLAIILCSMKSSFKGTLDNFVAVTYENADDPQTKNLIHQFEKLNYNYKILGYGENWDGWYGRAMSYINYLKTLPPEIYVLLCDGRDVLINQDYNTFISKALEIRDKNNNKIIVGTEEGCCMGSLNSVYKAKNINENIDFIDLYMKQQKENSLSKKIKNKFYYINFGLLFGKASQLLDLFYLLNIQPGNDDQALLHKIYYENPDLLFLDHNHELFSNASHELKGFRVDISKKSNLCYYKWDQSKYMFLNTITNTYPSILQTPGKNWGCYKYLASKLLPNPQFY